MTYKIINSDGLYDISDSLSRAIEMDIKADIKSNIEKSLDHWLNNMFKLSSNSTAFSEFTNTELTIKNFLEHRVHSLPQEDIEKDFNELLALREKLKSVKNKTEELENVLSVIEIKGEYQDVRRISSLISEIYNQIGDENEHNN